MANMWPRALPDWVLADSRRKAEISVFRQFERVLDDSWHVFYSRPWWGISAKGGEVDGEADFIVAHPEHGLLFIEVKGGAVGYDPAREQWSSRDRNGIVHNIKDPVKQALTCKHRFLDQLKKAEGWPPGFIRFRYGVVFPDCASPPASALSVGPYQKPLFCCMYEFEHAFDRWILERLAQHPGSSPDDEQGLGKEGVAIVRRLVADPVSLKVPMAREVQGEIDAMEALLTGAQLTLISLIDQERRVLVEGGAGTGKTVLAIEMAVRYAENGQSVLFCCRSGPLAANIEARMKNFTAVTVKTFTNVAQLCDCRGKHATRLPHYGLWDVVIVDEGQDFDWEWWDLIDQIVQARNGLLRVFADSNQAVYRRRDDLETRLSTKSFALGVNLRNTRAIANVTNSLYRGPLILAPGPEGSVPFVTVCSLETAIQSAVEFMVRLIREEELHHSEVALLVPNAEIREQINSLLARIRIFPTDASRKLSGSSVVDTVARFKGLESPFILIVADRELAKNQELSYVGVSRARGRLMVYGPISGTPLEAALASKRN